MININEKIKDNKLIINIENIFKQHGFINENTLYDYIIDKNDERYILTMIWDIRKECEIEIDKEEYLNIITQYSHVIYELFTDKNFWRCKDENKLLVCKFAIQLKKDFIRYVKEIK